MTALSSAATRLAPLRTAFALLSLAVLAGLPPLAAQGSYQERLTLIPRVGQGAGTLSSYAGVTPVIAQDAQGIEAITIPAPGGNEVNLVWTFWRHRMPAPETWPAGPGARTVFTLRSAADVTLLVRSRVNTGAWTDLVFGPEIQLKANQPTLVEVPLPETLPPGSIDALRIIFVSSGHIPELQVMEWSVGEGGKPLAAVTAPGTAPRTLAPKAEDVFFTPQRSFLPVSGDGTFSNYASTRPVVEKDSRGNDVLRIAETGSNEINLVWTFWNHKRPPAAQWPAGPNARASLTLTSAADVTLRPRLLLKAGDWSSPIEASPVTLVAGESSTIQIPLPEYAPTAPIENLRIILAASRKIPEIAVTEWSVGEER